MKVLLLITKGELGGAQQSVLVLATGLKARGGDVAVGFGEGWYLENELKKSGINFVKFKHLKRTLNPITNLLFIWELRRFLIKSNYQVLHCNSTNTLFAALGAKLIKPGPKVVFTWRGLSILDENYKNTLTRGVYKILFWLLLKFCDHQVFVSEVNQTAARKLNLAKNSRVIYNGVNLPREGWGKEEARAELAAIIGKEFVNNKFLVGSIGRLAYQKNYAWLLNALAQNKALPAEMVFLIIGDGPEELNLKNLATKLHLNDRVIFTGGIEKASRFLPAFDIFVLPSRYEGMSLTLLEALNVQLPIIASDIPPNRETLREAALFFGLNDSPGLVNQINHLAMNPSARIKLSQLAAERAKDFAVTTTVASYQKLYAS
ncbi:MAG: glycosyltransferase [Candidatus Magasanikbacteria bacterium]|nr:glycosyltransferase [Candidatus Magasanikbacteria bacterium]